jgi:hypothetical protein
MNYVNNGVTMKPEPTIIANRIRTPDGTILQSYNRHDYKVHLDKNGEQYMVDGGCDYLRRSSNVIPAEDMTVWSDDPHEMIREAMHWGTRGVDGKQPLRYVSLKDMTTDHIEACLNTQQHMHLSFRKAMQDELEYRK